ncbi:hypothetical protein DFJ74DRAFT_671973 [Hyaloraphidium curvatum]|nr:hypothetical protein DFJ74DRAFT_671973 [Hyaloraphidium curvatum]
MRRFGFLVPLLLLGICSAAPASANGVSVVNFVGANGALPSASPNCYPARLTWNRVATCYGATYVGGPTGYGAVYATDGDGSNLRVIFSFDVFTGLMPSQSPVLGPDGATVYGTTSQGGSAGSGVIYSVNAKTGAQAMIASFTGPGGSTPQGPPIVYNGKLYGLAGQGGANGYGIIYSLPLSGGQINVLHNFKGGSNDTATSFGSLLYNPKDNLLYGMGFTATSGNIGGIFSIRPDGSNYRLRARFSATTSGAVQMGGFARAPNGLLYGNGWVGGAYGKGALFAFNPATNVVKPVFNYNTTTGTQPYNSPAISTSGKWIFVLTWQGGAHGDGTILAVSLDGRKYAVLKNFERSVTGGQSSANPTLTVQGDRLLAAMSNGGSFNTGTLVSMWLAPEFR